MSRREAWLTALGIFAFALVVRAVAASAVAFPKPEDTAYYVGVARNLVEGRGIISDALWSYGTPPLVFPRPAFEVWLPLPSLLFAIPIALFGATAPIPLETALRASQGVTVLLGALLCVLAWRLAADVAAERGLEPGRARTLAIGTGLTTAVYLPLLLHAVQPDSTILFGVLGAWRVPADDARAARPTGRAPPGPAPAGDGPAGGRRRAHPQRGPLGGDGLGLARDPPLRVAAPGAPAADRRGRRREPAGVRAMGRPRLGRLRQPAARARRCRTPCRSPGSTSSPGTTRRRSRATSRWARRGSSRCAWRASPTTSSTSWCCWASRCR